MYCTELRQTTKTGAEGTNDLALVVSPLFARLHGHTQHIVRIDAVSHASTRRAL